MRCDIYPEIPAPHSNSCAHTYAITHILGNHPDGGVIVMGDDNEAHVVSETCVEGHSKGPLRFEERAA